jgi:hypothetical protein
MEFKKVLITPDLAKSMLEKNSNNRGVKIPVVLRYANDMIKGNWNEETAEMIKITDEGDIVDGQHRLMAVVKSNKSVFFYVAYGLDKSTFKYLDTGVSRSAGDVFKIDGIKNYYTIASIISAFHVLKKVAGINVQKNNKLTNSELLEVYYENPEFWQFIARKADVWYDGFAKILSKSSLGAFFATFHKINSDDAENFMNQLCLGLNVKNKTIELLRKRLIQEKLATKKTTPYIRNSMILKTWNLYRKGETVKVLKFDPEKESFPKAI